MWKTTLWLGLALACTKAPAAPAPAPADARIADAAGPDAAPRAPAAPAAPAKGKQMSPDEQAITAYYAAKGWTPVDVTQFERIPGMYRIGFADGIQYLALAGGKVITTKGLAAATAFLHDSKALSHKASATDVIMVLILFEAMPPNKLPAADQYYDFPEHSELNPRLELDGGGKLTLCYLMPNSGHAVANPQIARITRWTLAFGGKPAWKSEELKFDMSK